jgi:predicted Zn finger-like uncharacterized protein
MVIDCIQCHTEYRLNRVFFQEAKKGRPVRCHKCGCTFDVLIITPTLQDDEVIPQLKFQLGKGKSN